jgi:hypothetical protein
MFSLSDGSDEPDLNSSPTVVPDSKLYAPKIKLQKPHLKSMDFFTAFENAKLEPCGEDCFYRRFRPNKMVCGEFMAEFPIGIHSPNQRSRKRIFKTMIKIFSLNSEGS